MHASFKMLASAHWSLAHLKCSCDMLAFQNGNEHGR